MRKEVLIPLILMSIIFLIPKAHAFAPFPKGAYDEDFSTNGLVWNSSSLTGYWYTGGVNYSIGAPSVPQYGVGYFGNIQTGYLYVRQYASSFTVRGQIPDGTSYIFVCYRVAISYSGGGGEAYARVSIDRGDSTVFNFYYVHTYYSADRSECKIADFKSISQGYPTSEFSLVFASYSPYYSTVELWIYSIQYLDSDFKPLGLNASLVYKSDYYSSNLDDRYDPFQSWWKNFQTYGDVNISKNFEGSNFNILGSSENYWKNWTYNATTSGKMGIQVTPNIYSYSGYSTSTNLQYYWILTDVYQNPVTNQNEDFYFYIKHYDPSIGKFDYQTEINLKRKSGTVSYYLLDQNLNIIKAKTDIGFASVTQPFRISFYRPLPQYANVSFFTVIMKDSSGAYYSGIAILPIDNDYIVDSNIQSYEYSVYENTSGSILMSTYKYYSLQALPPPSYTITSCSDITSPGTYVLDNDLVLTDTSRTSCINIQADNVTLDLNGHTITTTVNAYYGIYAPGWLQKHNYIEIRNGTISGFQIAITFSNYANAVISNIRTNNNVNGISISAIDNLTIDNCNLMDSYPSYSIPSGSISRKELDISYIYGGAITNTNIGLTNPANNTYIWLDAGIYGVNIYNTLFKNLNVYGRVYAGYFSNIHNNTFQCNIWNPTYYSTGPTLVLDSQSTNNYGCSNEGTLNIMNSQENTFEPQCPPGVCAYQICVQQYVCLNSSYSGYQHSDCSITDVTYCQYGCDYNTGKCKSSPTQYCGNGICESEGGENSINCPQDCPPTNVTTTTTPTGVQPIGGLNATEWQEAGYGWALFLFSPMFIVTIIGIAIAGLIAGKVGGEQKGLVFAIAFLALVFIFMLAGAYPSWLGIVFIIIAGALVAWFAKGFMG